MKVETFKTDNIVFIGNVIKCLTTHYNLQYDRQYLDTDNITLRDQRKNVKITDK
jgi:hypothetical protein